MEKDFMGLAVKLETPDEVIDAAPIRSLAMQWSFSNKASTPPQLLCFHGASEEKPKTGFDSLASTGLVKITTLETFNSDHKSHSAVMQNLIGSVNPKPLAGVPMLNPVSAVTSSSTIVGSTDLRNTFKISGASAQLTIFYNGSVCVYNNISPEKAQAIMLLAGNGPPTTSDTEITVAPVQASMLRSSVLDGFVATTAHCSSPLPITSSILPQPSAHSGTMINMTASKPGVIACSKNVEPLKAVDPRGSVSATFLPLGTVPQFRRKSLARFLEKRKERVMNASPLANKHTPDSSIPGAGDTNLTVTSSESSPVQAFN